MVALRIVEAGPARADKPDALHVLRVLRVRAAAALHTPFVALSPRAALAGALGAMSALSDVAAPGLGPVVDLAVGAATALVAVDGALAVGRREGTPLAARALFVDTLREAATDLGSHTAPGAFLALAGDVVDGRPAFVDLARIAGRLAWSGLRRLLGGKLGDVVPGVGAVSRVMNAGRAARRGALVVSTLERAAEKVCRRAAPSPASCSAEARAYRATA